MQAFTRWAPPSGTLGQLVGRARDRAAELRPERADWAARAADAAPALPFGAALGAGSSVAVIAEVKRRSPSKGDIRPTMSCAAQAAAYARGGAAALSILTEPTAFGGSDGDLAEAAGATRLPLLKKDFHVDPVQVLQARALGASALLLIARALDRQPLVELVALAREVGIETLVEIRDEEELGRALEAGAEIVGVNNRNLETLAIDPSTSRRIIPLIPAGAVAVAESGMQSVDDVRLVAEVGADAVLVGSSVSAAADPAAAVRALTGEPRVGRRRDR